jgi:hypothetical protein
MLRPILYVQDTMGGMLHAYTVLRDVVLSRPFCELLQRHGDSCVAKGELESSRDLLVGFSVLIGGSF